VQLEGSPEFTALLIDDKAVMTTRTASTLRDRSENKVTRKDLVLGA